MTDEPREGDLKDLWERVVRLEGALRVHPHVEQIKDLNAIAVRIATLELAMVEFKNRLGEANRKMAHALEALEHALEALEGVE